MRSDGYLTQVVFGEKKVLLNMENDTWNINVLRGLLKIQKSLFDSFDEVPLKIKTNSNFLILSKMTRKDNISSRQILASKEKIEIKFLNNCHKIFQAATPKLRQTYPVITVVFYRKVNKLFNPCSTHEKKNKN